MEQAYSEFANVPGLQISGKCVRTTPLKDAEGKIKTLAYHDIMREGVTKAKAIRTLANHLGIRKEEIIAIGDGGNDIEMLQEAGLKIAMKNSTEALKAIVADKKGMITEKDNNEGGVGMILNDVYRVLEKKEKEKNEHLSALESIEWLEPDF